MAGSRLGTLLRYGESELDPAVQAEILLESARNEARAAILELLVAVGFGVWFKFRGEAFQAVAIFAIITVLPLLVDSQLRRSAARRLLGLAPHPPKPVKRHEN
ncbi:MAG: hypothetical protein V4510_12560 [bacterium]